MRVALFTGMSLNDASDTPEQVMRTTIDAVQIADEGGFDIAWFAEHHFSQFSICGSPLMMAMHCAALTRRIKLGPGVLVLPLHDPLRVLTEIGMLDVASGGRAVVGIGNGHQPHEFRSFGVDLDTRHEVFLESWDVLEMAWREGQVTYAGKHLRIPQTFLPIGPLGGRLPELLVAVHDPQMMARAVRAGAVVFISPGPRSMERAVGMRAQVFAAAPDIPSERVRLGLQRYVFVTGSRATARKAAESMLHFMRKTRSLRDAYPPRSGMRLESVPFDGEPDAEWLLDHAPIGDAAVVAERLSQDIAALRPEILSVYMAYAQLPPPVMLASVEHFARDVLPAIKTSQGLNELRAASEISASAPR
jgi:alkanesulfonate monooxygenase SsuD/methylene tetrahydromethanopterin reductase-like flavin-dependent oxidoreductase (luciferase family)